MSKLGSRMIQAANEARAFAAGEAVRGYVVHDVVDVKALRRKLGLAQPAFAARYNLSVGTVRDWEQGRAAPDKPAQALLRIIEAEPEVAHRILGGRKAAAPRKAAGSQSFSPASRAAQRLPARAKRTKSRAVAELVPAE